MPMLVALAWRNLWRNWRRTAIAVLAIVLGLMLLILMDGLIKGSDQALFGNAVKLYGGNIEIHAPGYRARASRLPLYPLTDANAAVKAASALPNVVAATQRINTSGLASGHGNSHAVVITGVQPDQEKAVSLIAEHITDGRYLLPDDGDAVVIGRGLADLLGAGVGDRVAILGHGRNEAMRQRNMTVVGIYNLGMAEAEKGMVYITLPEAQSVYRLNDQATEVAVSLRSIGQEPAVMAALNAALPGYEIDTWNTLKPEFQQTLDAKFTYTSFFGLVVLLIASIGILNLLLMAVFERTREMGVLAALGMKGRQVMTLFLLEGMLIGLIGAIIGCFLGWLVVLGLGRVGIDISAAASAGDIMVLLGNRLYPSITLAQMVSRGITVVFIAALAALYPAWLAARKQPADALHHV
jgi:ABC-type lipoprotein release transport system permease subunit